MFSETFPLQEEESYRLSSPACEGQGAFKRVSFCSSFLKIEKVVFQQLINCRARHVKNN